MTPTDRLSTALSTLRWGPLALAEAIDVNERTVRRWLAGQNDPPSWVVTWLERVAALLRANPPPGH